MCGIGGILGEKIRADERESAALRMQAALRHRGPDDHAIFNSTSGLTTLVHTRLAILDPSLAGRQPMTRGPLSITFNGEIYNFRELRRDLMAAGEVFRTESDTEVLLALYARHGSACLPHLRGMFSFAIWDEEERSCFLARDPFGIKPLYHARLENGGLIFASELGALLATGLLTRKINPAAVDAFLTTGSVPEPLTMIAGAECLEAGGWLRWKENTLERGTHFIVDFEEAEESPTRPSALTRSALLDSIQHHFISDVPVGLLLSGGLDSSALLALARRGGMENIATFSLGVEDGDLDETVAARNIARHFGANHHEMLLTQELARHWIDGFLEAIDQPTLDGFNTYCACKLVSDHGFRVALSGIGADELFGGYPSFRQVPHLLAAGKALRPFRPIASLAAKGAGRIPTAPRLSRSFDYFAGAPDVTRAYGAIRGVFTGAETLRIRQILLSESDTTPAARMRGDESPLPPNIADAISRLELTRYMRNQLLRDADVMSMAHGLELRVPLLDTTLFATLRTIPAAIRLSATKQLLRDAVPELPIELLAQRKRGFSLPFGSWLDEEWNDLAADLPMIRNLSLTSWYRKWSLIVLVRWLRRHGTRGLSS
jgi:asparagine synthase (glutamine-hydrolysing)